MAILRKSLLGLTTACIVSGGASAQDDPKELIKQAWRLVMVGKKAEAKPVLEKVLKQDPSQEEAFALWQKIDKDIWHELLLTRGEVGKIAQSILTKARAGATALSRDEAAIAALITKALDDEYGVRVLALRELRTKHGAFAVPGYIEKLGDHDDDNGSTYAIAGLQDLGDVSTLPLIEALKSENSTLRRNIAAVFNLTRDHRAIPAMTALLKDENQGVVTVAKAALKSLGASEDADAVSLQIKQSQEYLVGVGTQGRDFSGVVWSFENGKLTYKDCDPAVYAFELAKKSAEKALEMDPSSTEATTLIARSYLAQCSAIDNAGIESLAGVRSNLNMVAMAMGPKVLNHALIESLRDRQPYVAVAAIEALGNTIDRDAIADTALLSSLDSPNKMVAYAAALAVTKASRADNVPQSDKVVAVLAQAVSEQKLTRVATVGFGGEALRTMGDVSNDKAGVVVEANFNTRNDLVGQVMVGAIRPDVIIVNHNLPDGIPSDIIGILGDNERTKNIEIFVAGGNADTYEGKSKVKVIDANMKSDDLRSQVTEAVKSMTDKLGARAAAVAKDSSNALYQLASNRVDISGAVPSIATELTREDAVAVPVAKALGEGASSIDPLVTVLGGDGSLELKIASAESTGKILGREHNITAEQFTALKTIAADASLDAKLRTAVTTALGKADLSPAQNLELVKILSTPAVAGG